VRKLANRIVVLCASTGGPKAISFILKKLLLKNSSMIIIQHLTPNFSDIFVENLQEVSSLPIKKIEDGDVFEDGKVYVVPSTKHLVVEGVNFGISKLLDRDKVDSFYLPSMDVTLSSLVGKFKDGIMVVVLTGMGNDTVKGIKKLKTYNKDAVYVVAQGKESSVIFGMNKRVIELGLADKVLELQDIPDEIMRWDKGICL
jgi:two-component system chemotaxis response regulator CheB